MIKAVAVLLSAAPKRVVNKAIADVFVGLRISRFNPHMSSVYIRESGLAFEFLLVLGSGLRHEL